MFALESLALLGQTYANSKNVRRACTFLIEHQMEDGGWGESFEVRLSFLSFPLFPFLLFFVCGRC